MNCQELKKANGLYLSISGLTLAVFFIYMTPIFTKRRFLALFVSYRDEKVGNWLKLTVSIRRPLDDYTPSTVHSMALRNKGSIKKNVWPASSARSSMKVPVTGLHKRMQTSTGEKGKPALDVKGGPIPGRCGGVKPGQWRPAV